MMHRFILLLCLVSGSLHALDIDVIGSERQTLSFPPESSFFKMNRASSPRIKEISLLKLTLSERAKATFRNRLHDVNADTKPRSIGQTHSLPSSIQLGMNQVPVLDQGVHGTCATFANTAAVDAALNKGDYISQLCLLQLGRFLEEHAYAQSGWDGSFGPLVLHQMSLFGVISKARQSSEGCGGYTEYPINGYAPQSDVSPIDYHQLSDSSFSEAFTWSSILDIYQAALQETNTMDTLQAVKKALHAGDRVTFGVMLVDLKHGVAGAIGQHHRPNDTWLLTPEIRQRIEQGTDFGGHEMVITGYDDEAGAVDDYGRKHLGLLTLRNSWGKSIGDGGNFYMSYDYFKALVLEAQRIRKL